MAVQFPGSRVSRSCRCRGAFPDTDPVRDWPGTVGGISVGAGRHFRHDGERVHIVWLTAVQLLASVLGGYLAGPCVRGGSPCTQTKLLSRPATASCRGGCDIADGTLFRRRGVRRDDGAQSQAQSRVSCCGGRVRGSQPRFDRLRSRFPVSRSAPAAAPRMRVTPRNPRLTKLLK